MPWCCPAPGHAHPKQPERAAMRAPTHLSLHLHSVLAWTGCVSAPPALEVPATALSGALQAVALVAAQHSVARVHAVRAALRHRLAALRAARAQCKRPAVLHPHPVCCLRTAGVGEGAEPWLQPRSDLSTAACPKPSPLALAVRQDLTSGAQQSMACRRQTARRQHTRTCPGPG